MHSLTLMQTLSKKPFPLYPTTGSTNKLPLTPMKRLGDASLQGFRIAYPGQNQIIAIAKQWIEHYRGEQFVRDQALKVTRRIVKNPRTRHPDMRNYDAVAQAIHDFIVREILYVRDQNGIERLQTPDATLLLKSGDCDDMAILSGALLESVGVPTRLRLIGHKPGKFVHIFVDYKNQHGQWKTFDPTLALYPGFEYPKGSIGANKTVLIDQNDRGLSDFQPQKKVTMSTSQFVHPPETTDEELGVVITAATVGTAFSIAKGAAKLFKKGGCSSAQKDARSQIQSAIGKYLTLGEMQRLVAMAKSDVKANPESMAYFYMGEGDCKHKNVSPGDQQFLDELESLLTMKEAQASTAQTTATSASLPTMTTPTGSVATTSGLPFPPVVLYAGGGLILVSTLMLVMSGRNKN